MSLTLDSMDSIQRFVEERERRNILQFQRQIEDTERLLKQNNAYYSDLIQRLESQGHAIHDLVKRMREGYVNLCSLMQKEHAQMLQNYKNALSKKFKKFRSDFEKYRLTLTQNSASIADVEQRISDFDVEVPASPQHLSNFTFVENADPLNDISSAFGLLRSGRRQKESKQKQERMMAGSVTRCDHERRMAGSDIRCVHERGMTCSNISCELERDVNAHLDKSDVSTQTEDNLEVLAETIHCLNTRESCIQEQEPQRNAGTITLSNLPEHQIITQPKKDTTEYCLSHVSHFKHSSAFTAICATADGTWIAFDRINKVTLVDLKGNAIRSVMARARVDDICISHTSTRLWVACSNNCIVEYYDTGAIGVVLSLSNRISCFCLTVENHVVVGSMGDTVFGGGSISVYNTKGVKINKIQGPLMKPLRITSHCQDSRDTAIAVVHGGNDVDVRPCVTVYNGLLEPQFTYKGKRQPFHPGGLCFYSDGNLLVCDQSSSSIDVLDGLGDCLFTVPVGPSCKPLLLSVDVNLLWVGYGDNTVKVSRIE